MSLISKDVENFGVVEVRGDGETVFPHNKDEDVFEKSYGMVCCLMYDGFEGPFKLEQGYTKWFGVCENEVAPINWCDLFLLWCLLLDY